MLHVASFSGNIGDNASHSGTYGLLSEVLSGSLRVTRKEIRKTYLNYRGPDAWKFDERFIAEANRHDITVIGGGNYFELWLEGSSTGTTVDLSPPLLEDLEQVLVFNGLGCDPYKGYSQSTIERFGIFLEATAKHPLALLSVRNDGSMDHIQRLLGSSYLSGVAEIPDPGFFVQTDPEPRVNLDGRYWALNLACDMPEIRFGAGSRKRAERGYRQYIEDTAEALSLNMSRDPELRLVLIPHIYSDLRADIDLMDCLPESLRRSRVSVAAYGVGSRHAASIFSIYRSADAAIGSRFHANVCAIGLGVPSLGLVSYQKVADLYDNLEMEDRYVSTHSPTYLADLTRAIDSTIHDGPSIRKRYIGLTEELRATALDFYARVGSKLIA